MTKKTCIKQENMPKKLPIMTTAFWWMFLDYTEAPEWLFGAFAVLLVIAWIAAIHKIVTYDQKDVFETGAS